MKFKSKTFYILKYLGAILFTFLVCFLLATPLSDWLVQPFFKGTEIKHVFTSPGERLFSHFYTAIWGAAAVLLPLIAFDFMKYYFADKLDSPTSKMFYFALTWILYAAGLLVAYFIILPFYAQLFRSMTGGAEIQMLPRYSEVLYFSMRWIWLMGFLFLIPLFVLLFVQKVDAREMDK